MAQTRLIGTAPEQVPTNGMLGTIAFQDASSVNLGSVSVQQLLGQVPAPLGTAGAPTFTFTGDLNTGIYSPGADQVALSTGGTGRVVVDASGRVGIGVLSPSQTFQARSSSGGTTARFENTSTGNFIDFYETTGSTRMGFMGHANASDMYVHNDKTGPLIFDTNNLERLRITSAGNVGIGTSSPGAELELSSADNTTDMLISEGASPSTNRIRNVSGILRLDADINNTGALSSAIILGVDNTERARIDSSGRLLVGTSTARSNFDNTTNSKLFQIEGTNAAAASVSIVRSSADVSQPALYLAKTRGPAVGSNAAVLQEDVLGSVWFSGADGTSLVNAANIQAIVDGPPGTGDMPGRLVFGTTADGASSPTERLRIANDGRHTINSSAHQGTALTTTAPAKLYTSTGTYTDTATAASGTVTHGTIVAFDNPAIAATNATVTYTNASTVYIDGAPTNGTNVTITNPFALFVAAGESRFGGNVLSSSATGGIGYATGAGSAQTQTTSRTQGVTINTICGAITLFSAAGTTAWQSFTVTNSTVAATDNVIVNQRSGTDLYMIHVTNVAAGSFQITYATTGGTTTEQPVFNFSVIKAVAA